MKPVFKAYKLVQFSVHIAGLFGELGPANVSPHLLPLHVLICKSNLFVSNPKNILNKQMQQLKEASWKVFNLLNLSK